jgi:hypothetical protein
MEANMGFGKGALLWLIGIPLPIIIILALFHAPLECAFNGSETLRAVSL